MEIGYKEISELPVYSYLLLDIRSEENRRYGMLPDAKAWDVEAEPGTDEESTEKLKELRTLAGNKKIIVYCARGEFSVEYAEYLRGRGLDACSLKGGYTGWLLDSMEEEREHLLDRTAEIEKSIRKKFHKSIFSKFAKAINQYELLQENDRVAVCISGGKDSMLMAKLFQELQRHNKFHFELVFLVMDPGYSKANRQVIENNAKLLNIPVTIFESDIFDAVYTVEKSPCYLCARMRRGHLYRQAKELGCNKIALGHHYDDVIETILMGMLYSAQVQTMMPKLHSQNFEGMELIRPMYLIREDDIKHWRDYNGLHFLQCACHFTDNCSSCREDGTSASKRLEIKKLIASLKETNPFIEGNIFKSVENVNLDTVVGYKENGIRHYFTEDYDSKISSSEE